MRSWIGFNLPGIRPTDRGACFNEATACADWYKTPDNKTPLPLTATNAAGYPTGDFAWTIFYKCPPGAYNGVYTLELFGAVSGVTGISSPLRIDGMVSANGRTMATITVNASKPGESASMTLKFTGVQNITRIRIWRGEPPADRVRRWNPATLALLKKARAGCLRFMEPRRINNAATDATPESPMFTYAGPGDTAYLGLPPELAFDLCNECDADCWYNVRVDATDEQARAEFTVARDRLEPDVFLRLQLGNELWGMKFGQKRGHDIAQAKGKELAAAGEPGFAGLTDPNVLGWRWNAYRSVQLVKLARDVFGPQAHRVRATLAGQMYDNRPLDEARKYLREVGINPADYFDSYAVTHYFGAARADLEATIAALPADAVATLSHRDADQFFDACRQDGVRPDGYETGAGIESQTLSDPLMRDPRVKDANAAALNAWRGKGGGLWMKFTAWGDWGKSTYAATDDPTWESPTLQAFAEFGPTWPYDLRPDPKDTEIQRLREEARTEKARADLFQQQLQVARDESAALMAERAETIADMKALVQRLEQS